MRTDADFVPSVQRSSSAQVIQRKGNLGTKKRFVPPRPSLYVRGQELGPITSRYCNGMSADEIRLLSEGLHHLARTRRPCLHVTVGENLLSLDEADARATVHHFKSRIVREQIRAELPEWWVAVYEGRPQFHAHLVFPAPPGLDVRIRGWRPFEPYVSGEGAVRWADDLQGLVGYLAKLRTTEADFAMRCAGVKLGPRVQGSHPLGEGGGDCVNLSRALKAELLDNGRIRPYRRTTSCTLRKRHQGIILAPLIPTTSYQDVPLFAELPLAPKAHLVARAIRAERQRQGMTQAALGERLGIRQPHLANVERLHDALSSARARAALYVLTRAG